MEETSRTTTSTTMVALTPQNFHQWLKELKGIAEKANVWTYTDPDGKKEAPTAIEQIHEKFQTLRQPPPKQKIEKWVADWENLKSEIIDKNITGFGTEAIFAHEFLKSGKKWAPSFYETWVRRLGVAEEAVEFFATTRQYRLAVRLHSNESKYSSRGQANTASLQGQPPQHDTQQPQKATGGKESKSKEEWLATRKCVCGLVHLFNKCPHLVQSIRPPRWP